MGISVIQSDVCSWSRKKKKNLHTSSSQLRADQAPNTPWGDRLIYTDQINVTDL